MCCYWDFTLLPCSPGFPGNPICPGNPGRPFNTLILGGAGSPAGPGRPGLGTAYLHPLTSLNLSCNTVDRGMIPELVCGNTVRLFELGVCKTFYFKTLMCKELPLKPGSPGSPVNPWRPSNPLCPCCPLGPRGPVPPGKPPTPSLPRGPLSPGKRINVCV